MGRLGALLRPTWRSYAGPPQGHYKAPLCCELLMKGLLFRVLLSHRSAGGRWCRKAPKGGSHRRWLITVVHIIPYDTESKSRNADFISIARRAIHNPRPERPSNLRTLRTLRTFGAQPRQSSRHRRVQWRSRIGGGERSEPIRRMLIMLYDAESQSRNADFISIAAERQSTTLGPKGRQT